MAKNNETTTKFKVDISELKKSMQEAKKQVAYANSEFKAVSSSMDDWSKSSDGISAKLKQLNSNLKSQENILNEYEKTLEEVKKEYGENSKEALDYATKLNNQQAVVNKIKKEISGYEDALKEVSDAEKIASKTGQDVADVLADVGDKAEEAGDGFTVLKGSVAEFVGNALTQLVDGLKNCISSLVTFSDEADKAMNSFQASTGATAEEMAGFEDTMKNIYNGNYGESFEDIATAMGQVKRVAGDIGADELEKMTTDAIILRDTFDFEVSESMRAVNSLMDQFGITADEAFNLLAQGAQNGLNQNDDLLDTINEYSVQFQNAGYSAEDMFNMLKNGVDSGTWSVDKLGDAVKEFNIRMSDGSAQEAIENLGFSWEGMSSAWSKGGEEAKEVFNILMNELDGLTNETDGYNIGVGLLGTMFEDLGADAVLALSQTDGEISKTKDSLAEIDSIKYNTVGEAISGIGRNIQTGILMPIGDELLPTVSDLATKFQEWLNDPATQEGIKNLTDSVTEFVDNGLTIIKDGVQWFLANKDAVIAGLAGIATGFLAFKVVTLIQGVQKAMQGMTVAQYALNLAMSLNPIGIVVALIAGLVVAFVTLWKKSESFRQFWLNLWDGIKNAVSVAKEWIAQKIDEIGKFFTETLPAFIDTAIEFIKELPSKVWTWLVNTIEKVVAWKNDMVAKAGEMALSFINKVIEFIEQLPSKVWTWLLNTINKIIEWRNNMIAKAGEMALSFINKVIEFIKQLPEKVWTWLTNVITKVVTWGVNLASKGKEAGQKLMDSLIEKVKEIPEKMLSIGEDIVKGLWNGISNATQWLKDRISDFVGDVTGWLKDKFEIGSPSKLMAREIGKWLPAGIAVGIDDNAKTVMDSMKNLAIDTVGSARAGLQRATTTLGSNGVVTGGVVNNFYQTINSPKQLSRLDIYRQSKNLLGYAGGGF